MQLQNNLEINGNLRDYIPAELLVEISQNCLNGSLRINNEAQKFVIYFDAGEIVFAVSNARAFRLYEILLRENQFTKEQLAPFSDFTNDLILSANLVKNNLLGRSEISRFTSIQISEIIKAILDLRTGEWVFSPLVRIKGDIRYKVDLNKILIDFARNRSPEETARRFKSIKEYFAVKRSMPVNIDLNPQEAFVFSRFDESALTIEKIQNLSGLSETTTFSILYTLWLGGFLVRRDWNAAFSESKVAAINDARLKLKKDAPAPGIKPQIINEEQSKAAISAEEDSEITEKEEKAERQITVDEYLAQVENATNFYELLNLEIECDPKEIKLAYFALAKRFHPDLFHRQEDVGQNQKIQTAFTKIAQAYDTLKAESSRRIYDFKLRKELTLRKSAPKSQIDSADDKTQKQNEQASKSFEVGFSLLMDGNLDTALPYLTRAVNFAPDVARYHAYYGKALSADRKQQHKAEAALQTAIRLDPNNIDFRLMLAEFFIQIGLLKRAEGELNRLLTSFPDNHDAKLLLDSLKRK
jgi:curved DNA-binding protein CbpA